MCGSTVMYDRSMILVKSVSEQDIPESLVGSSVDILAGGIRRITSILDIGAPLGSPRTSFRISYLLKSGEERQITVTGAQMESGDGADVVAAHTQDA